MIPASIAFASDAPFFKGDIQAPAVHQGLSKYEQNVGIDQHLGQAVTLSLPVRDENGNVTTLGTYFGKRPVILVMAYYECPNLCTMVMNGIFASTKATAFIPGKDFDVVSVSINPHETAKLALDKKNSYLSGYHEQNFADGFHFLTADESTIEMLTKEVGFRYNYDSESHQYAHASDIMVMTSSGKISRYFMGVRFSPKDLKFALMDASNGTIGTLAEKLVLFCYQCEPSQSKYGLAIARLLKIGGTLMILAIIAMYVYFQRRARKLKLAPHA
ncbi:MAG TPA: SCO family protein [Candidatus Kapabacteria bacterium]|jgi:protein SCO1/2